MSTQSPLPVPLVPLVVETFGTLLLALGVLVLFAPDALAGLLPRDLLTPAVGWTAAIVGLAVSLVGVWQLVSELRRRAAAARH